MDEVKLIVDYFSAIAQSSGDVDVTPHVVLRRVVLKLSVLVVERIVDVIFLGKHSRVTAGCRQCVLDFVDIPFLVGNARVVLLD